MRPPIIAWVAAWFQLVPVAVAAFRVRHLTAIHAGVVAWLVLLALKDLVSWAWSNVWGLGNNMLVSYAFMPLELTAIMWSLSEWQVTPVARLTVRYAIPLLWLWWGINFALFEDQASFSVLGGPVYGLLALVAALLALTTRALRETEPLLSRDWCWIVGGIAIFFATNTATTLLQAVAVESQNWHLLDRSVRLKSAIDIVAMLGIAGGFAWLSHRRSFGASSSPAPSR